MADSSSATLLWIVLMLGTGRPLLFNLSIALPAAFPYDRSR